MSDKTTTPSAASNRKSFDEIHADVKKEVKDTALLGGTMMLVKSIIYISVSIVTLGIAGVRHEMQDKE